MTATISRQGLPFAGYTHIQDVPSTTWNVTHELGKIPAVTIVDSDGNEIESSVVHISTSALAITFTAAFAGRAYLN